MLELLKKLSLNNKDILRIEVNIPNREIVLTVERSDSGITYKEVWLWRA